MTRQKDESEIALQQAKMILRRFVHLKHSLKAVEELNELEPALEKRFYEALQAGVEFTYDLKALVDQVDRVRA